MLDAFSMSRLTTLAQGLSRRIGPPSSQRVAPSGSLQLLSVSASLRIRALGCFAHFESASK